MGKVIVISGASAGIGKTAMQMLEKKGHTVYNLSRRPTPGNHIKTDVTSPEDIKNAIKQIYDKEGRIDALINNAGMGISGAIENTDLANAKRMFDVNFFGAFNLIREVLPYMRKSGGRHNSKHKLGGRQISPALSSLLFGFQVRSVLAV